MTIERVLEILEHDLLYERKKAAEAAVEDDPVWALAHTYGEILMEHVLKKIRKEDDGDRTRNQSADQGMDGRSRDIDGRDVQEERIPSELS